MSACPFVSNPDHPTFWIDLKDHNRIEIPVGSIEESAVRGKFDRRRIIGPDERLRQAGSALFDFERTFGGIVEREEHRGRLLVDYIGPLAIGVEGKMPRTGAG